MAVELIEIETFFATYRALEDKWTEVIGWKGRAETQVVIQECRRRFQDVKEGDSLP